MSDDTYALTPGACKESLQSVAQVPPSVQTVYCALYGQKPMTGRQLRDATHLPRRTIYAALQRLRELHVIQERASLRDTRQTYYWVGQDAAAVPAVSLAKPTVSAFRNAGLPAWAQK